MSTKRLFSGIGISLVVILLVLAFRALFFPSLTNSALGLDPRIPDFRHREAAAILTTGFTLADSMDRYKGAAPRNFRELRDYNNSLAESHGLDMFFSDIEPYYEFDVRDCYASRNCLFTAIPRTSNEDPSFCVVTERVVRFSPFGARIENRKQCEELPIWVGPRH